MKKHQVTLLSITAFSLLAFFANSASAQFMVKESAVLLDEPETVVCYATCYRDAPTHPHFSDIRLIATLPDGSTVSAYRAEYATRETCIDAVLEGGYNQLNRICYPVGHPLRCDTVIMSSATYSNGPVFPGGPVTINCP